MKKRRKASEEKVTFDREFYRVAEVCELLNLSQSLVERAIRAEDLQIHRFGRSVRISHQDLMTYIRRHKVERGHND